MTLEHGGKLAEAMVRYGHVREAWVDLSTGINPQSYSAPMLPADAWHRLPEASPDLIDAARAYYRVTQLLPVAGSQAAIQALPRLRPASRVAIGAPAYAEHAYRWRRAGHEVLEVPHAELHSKVDSCDVLVVCNPNNPTGATIASEVLLEWAERLARRGGWLVVDEAFADVEPQHSLATNRPGLIVLRSVGKFFGLAGLRLGFVIAEQGLLGVLSEEAGPWGVTEAAQTIGTAALRDRAWQHRMSACLRRDGARLQRLLAEHGITAHGCALFQWWQDARAEALAAHMAERAIWVRKFAHGGIRLGLPFHERDWQRLSQALDEWCSR
ncbi:MAG: threonine-phosphate decarboxylase [Burkholderiaceae bacterium]|nr:threonine-phosphate decarboxylase [Burkholderiaceae bacterium]